MDTRAISRVLTEYVCTTKQKPATGRPVLSNVSYDPKNRHTPIFPPRKRKKLESYKKLQSEQRANIPEHHPQSTLGGQVDGVGQRGFVDITTVVHPDGFL